MSTQPHRSTRKTRKGLVVAGLAVVALVVGGGVFAATHLLETKPPYTDPASSGLLTLCDEHGKTRTKGKVDDAVASVVLGSSHAPRGYRARGAVGSLFAYQPRQGVEASEFSGIPLTGSAAFADPDLPAAQVGVTSSTLKGFITAFPAKWDGFVQLRLIISAPHAGTLTSRYDSADLKVSGDTWSVVRGGHADCSFARSALLATAP